MKRKKDSCVGIYPTLQTKLSVAKAKYLSSTGNKERFLGLLKNYLMAWNIDVIQSSADADVMMCREAVEQCHQANVSLIGDDTDLLIILLHMTRQHAFEHKLVLTMKSHVYNIEETRNKLGSIDVS